MALPRSYQTEALVLKSLPVGEAGLIVTLYSNEHGKLRAAVRGVRKPTSKMVGHLEPLTRVQLALIRGKPGSLDTVTQAQTLESFSALKSSLEGISKGVYLTELVDGFGVEGSVSYELYSLVHDTLRFLNDQPEMDTVLRYFELKVLNCSGFMPELYHCVECRDELVPEKHLFSPELGGTLCHECTPTGGRLMRLSLQALKVLRFFDRSSLSDLPSLRIQDGLGKELENLLSTTLKYWLDKEIQSKSFIEHLEHSGKAGYI